MAAEPIQVYIDADGCAVKDEVYRVAGRYQLKVFVVANRAMNIPMDPKIEMKVVSGDFDAADDWIAETIQSHDLLITSDLLLADRCIKRGARVLGPKGRELDEENIGSALSGRELSAHLRNLGNKGIGPAAMGKTDRSQFLSKMDQIIQSAQRAKK
jgi:hypothetical protein